MSKRYLRMAILIALGVLTLAVNALAAPTDIDMDYSGQLDAFSGLPSGAQSAGIDSDLVFVSDSVDYERSSGMFVYTLASGVGREVRANVADGMVVSGVVRIVPDDGVSVVLYRNGSPVTDVNIEEIQRAGEYVVMDASGSGSDARIFAFTLVGETSGIVRRYNMPSGFQITSATLNGEPVSFSRSYVDFEQEGEYEIGYSCIRTGVTYDLLLETDFTAPTLALEAVVDGIAKGPVDLSDLEDGAGIVITRDGEILGYRQVLTESGNYEIKVVDPAGNISEYQFTIRVYFDSNSLMFFLIILVSIGATGAYVFLSKKRLRVR